MAQTRFELKDGGKCITFDQLYELAKDEVIGELDIMPMEYAIELGNAIRENNGYDKLYENCSGCLDDALEDEDPSTILKLDWDQYEDYFIWDGDELTMTCNVWYDLDTDDIAEAILGGEYSEYTTPDIDDVVRDYKEAQETLKKLRCFPKERIEGEELVKKYLNGDATSTDLLQYIEKLLRNDAVWKEV